MKKVFCLLAAAVCVLLSTQEASAQTCPSPFGCGTSDNLFKRLFVKQPLPAFQAAPWYLYWPYHAHFMTPAPLGLGADYYGPPTGGYGYGPSANPYFPNANMGYRKP